MSLDVLPGGGTSAYVRGVNLLRSDVGFFVYNAHGDVVRVVDAAGVVVQSYDYDAFGVEREPDAGDANPWRYCGEYFDVETGTVYLRARYYDPVIGLFISQDAWEFADPKDPLSLNLYTYCAGNPVMYCDPSGHSKWFDLGKGFRYRIDITENSTHIHIQDPHGKEWKQKSTGEPYEPNHKTTNKGDPPNWIKKLLKKNDDDNDKKGGSGTGGPGWDWDTNKKNYEDQQKENTKKAVTDSATVIIGVGAGAGAAYVVYRVVRILPSLVPPLWWTIPANLVCP